MCFWFIGLLHHDKLVRNFLKMGLESSSRDATIFKFSRTMSLIVCDVIMRQCQVEVQVLSWVQKMYIFGKHILGTKIATLTFDD